MNQDQLCCTHRYSKHSQHHYRQFSYKNLWDQPTFKYSRYPRNLPHDSHCFKVHYAKKTGLEQTPTKDISSDETKGDSDVPTSELANCETLPSPCKSNTEAVMTVTKEDLNDLISGKGIIRGELLTVPKEDKFINVSNIIPMPDFMNE